MSKAGKQLKHYVMAYHTGISSSIRLIEILYIKKNPNLIWNKSTIAFF